MANPAPGFARHPDHKITLHRSDERIRVSINGIPLAESRNSVILRESGYPPVHYLPKADIRTDWLVRSAHSTRCPFKGEATYWNVDAPDSEVENAGWSYETPYDEVAEIAGHIAFYTDRVDVTVGGDG
ncbi:DUF427 domain-containing protein [Stappia sp.]|uniref:DUF427 domain-containing protein n=1 Tax=Stappia sp. TaxID=1870903 RepID=UPI003D0B62ED